MSLDLKPGSQEHLLSSASRTKVIAVIRVSEGCPGHTLLAKLEDTWGDTCSLSSEKPMKTLRACHDFGGETGSLCRKGLMYQDSRSQGSLWTARLYIDTSSGSLLADPICWPTG